jgi:hypothetical protein
LADKPASMSKLISSVIFFMGSTFLIFFAEYAHFQTESRNFWLSNPYFARFPLVSADRHLEHDEAAGFADAVVGTIVASGLVEVGQGARLELLHGEFAPGESSGPFDGLRAVDGDAAKDFPQFDAAGKAQLVAFVDPFWHFPIRREGLLEKFFHGVVHPVF